MPFLSLFRYFNLLVALCFSFAIVAVAAQDGPPPEVRHAVSAVLAMVNSDSEQALEEFINDAADPHWVATQGVAQITARLREIRQATQGLSDDLSVEPAADGVLVVLSGGGVSKRLALMLSDAGISGISLLPEEKTVMRQPGRDGAVQAHITALEQSGRSELSILLKEFETNRFSRAYLQATTHAERRSVLEEIQAVAAIAGGAMIRSSGDEIILSLRGSKSLDVIFKVSEQEPFGIDALRTEAPGDAGPTIDLSWENAADSFRQLEQNGFSGVVHLARDGKKVLQSAYGDSNRELGYKTRLDTIYGIGSTPIDFTVTAVYLLAQQNKLQLEDRIGKFLGDVPADKAAMTIGHLISGQSGLPDFHGNPTQDWDQDLAWIDRDTAVMRILGQPLMFAPGSSHAHSHSAYGLAAAIIELASGQDYFSFLRHHILQPAGMNRTGMYGDAGGFTLRDFAVGYASQSVGVPNIPPNWGPTSWLVMGSGGMYSTLGDMLRFYQYVRSGKALEDRFAKRYRGEGMGIGGSERGFYFFHANKGSDKEAMMLMNGEGRTPEIHALSQALEALVMDAE